MIKHISLLLLCALKYQLIYGTYASTLPEIINFDNSGSDNKAICSHLSTIESPLSRSIHIRTHDGDEVLVRISLSAFDGECTAENIVAVDACHEKELSHLQLLVTSCGTYMDICTCDVAVKSTAGLSSVSEQFILIPNKDFSASRMLQIDDAQKPAMKNPAVQDPGADSSITVEGVQASAEKKFDIGIVTHKVLVVLSLIAFVGNGMFVVFVFWLSK
jgi:hypothetical protein